MKNTWWWVIVVGIIVSFGWYLFWQNNARLPSYTTPPSEPAGAGVVGNATRNTDPFDITITYEDDGFHPSNITIKQGVRVRFLNATNTEIWPASGVHPTHTLYPEKESTDCVGSSFDSCKELRKGEFFDFTFYYTGTWPFHDHLHPYDTGIITVEALPSH